MDWKHEASERNNRGTNCPVVLSLFSTKFCRNEGKSIGEVSVNILKLPAAALHDSWIKSYGKYISSKSEFK